MKTLETGMTAHIETGSHKLAWALQITRTDGEVFRYVSATRNATIEGNTYEAAPGFNMSSITCTLGFSVDTLKLTVLTTSALEHADFLAGRWNGARVDFNQYNWSDIGDGLIPWPSYRVANVDPIVGGFELELRDLRQRWRQDYTYSTSKNCQNRLGDSLCTVDLYFFTFDFTVTSVSSRVQFTDSALAQAEDYFSNGTVIFDDGLHAGMHLLVRQHDTGGVINLAVPLIQDIVVGQTGSIIAGCLKRVVDCQAFDNILNMRAAPHAPSRNRIAGGEDG